MAWYEWVLLGLCVAVFCVPPNYDPAIRFREREERRRQEKKDSAP